MTNPRKIRMTARCLPATWRRSICLAMCAGNERTIGTAPPHVEQTRPECAPAARQKGHMTVATTRSRRASLDSRDRTVYTRSGDAHTSVERRSPVEGVHVSMGRRLACAGVVVLLPMMLALSCGSDPPARSGMATGGAGTMDARSPGVPVGDLPAVRMFVAFPNLSFQRPLLLTHANDDSGRLFVIEQTGRIFVFADRPDASEAEVFLDVRERVRSWPRYFNEEGFLALAFHPQYRTNGYFYVCYTASNPRRSVLSRLSASADDPDRADANSEYILLEVDQPYANHNGSTVIFGPDGYLYVSLGDGGSAGDPENRAQNLGALLGKILRIDVNREEGGRRYAIPSDNPFVGRSAVRGEIWAYGLRNVWRMSFDRQTGDLWAGDVGQNAREEIDLITRGGNYGWRIREGSRRFTSESSSDPLIDPIVEYSHPTGLSVTGGYVYRGSRVPRLQGVYIYADYVTGRIWGLRLEDGRLTAHRQLLHQPKNILSFGEGPDGELYLLVEDGKIYQLEES